MRFHSVSPRARKVLPIILFAPAAILILCRPLNPLRAIIHPSFWNAILQGDVRIRFAADLIAWLACLVCAGIVGRAAYSLRNKIPFGSTSYMLFLFLLFFAAERFTGYAVGWPQLHWLTPRLQLIDTLGSIAVAIGAAALYPRLLTMMESAAIARREHDQFVAAAESSLDDFYIFDGVPNEKGEIVDFRFKYLNANAERRLHTTREKLLGRILTEVRPFMISSGLIKTYREIVRTGVPFTGEVFIDDDMIKATWINIQVVKLGDGIAITSRDVTERKRLTDHASHLAHYDQLTGLANRTLLQDRLQQAILRAQRQHQKVAVFMLDIDHFKRINDSLGHSDGDALLAAVGSKLLASVRETDTVARMGGDEFVIVMTDFKSLADVKRCGMQLVERAATPTMIGNREVNITVSVGLCIYPDCGMEAEHLLKNADAAMYVVKDSGRNGLHIFTESMLEGGGDELLLEDDLRYALVRNELALHYQPQVSCSTGEIVGMEALLRWQNARRGSISPEEFIPLAETTGLIVPIGEWALRTVCAEGKQMQERFGKRLSIAINLSPRQFRQKNLTSIVESALAESGLDPSCLEIEITEHTLMVNSTSNIETLQQLRKLGIRIAIDDFGTGFSSFSYILQYKVDRLKIDRSFVDRAAEDPKAGAIVSAIVAMAQGLDMEVVAEGVENIEQLMFLQHRRCDQAQGYYFSRPAPLTEFDSVVRSIARLSEGGMFGHAAPPVGPEGKSREYLRA